jgi:hypothetical protein
MKLLASLLCAVLLGVVLAGCHSESVKTPEEGQRSSMKGWELYSWQDRGQWRFSLLEGTNREKTVAEIQSPDTTLKGIEALRPALASLARGQYVTWWAPEWVQSALAFPSDDLVKQVQGICKDRGLQLAVVR